MVTSVLNLLVINGIFDPDCQFFSVMFLSSIKILKIEGMHKLSFCFCGYLNLTALKVQNTA